MSNAQHTQATNGIKQHRMPQTPTEYEQYLAEKFSRIINSPQFAFYEGFLEDYYRVPHEEDEFPGWILPINEGVVDDGNEPALSAAGVPSRSEGAAALGNAAPNTTLTPITNRGATLYRTKSQTDEPLRTQNNVSPRKNRHETPIDELPCPHIMGGYDGGVELGFDGKWPDKTFDRVIATLEAGRVAAQQKHNDARFITLADRQFLVQPYGGGKAVNYRYILEGDGIKIYFHHKPDGGIQPIRLRYTIEDDDHWKVNVETTDGIATERIADVAQDYGEFTFTRTHFDEEGESPDDREGDTTYPVTVTFDMIYDSTGSAYSAMPSNSAS